MRKLKLIFIGIFLAPLVFAEVDQMPQIFVEEPIYSFGSIPRGEVVEHNFSVQNIGNAPLEISQISTSCGCTSSEPTPIVIGPKETKSISVEFDSGGKSGFKKQSVILHTNDPENQTYTCFIEADVMPGVSFSPKTLDFGDIELDQKKNLTLRVQGLKDWKVVVTNITTSNLAITSKIISTNEDQNFVDVSVFFEPKEKIGPFRSWLNFKTNEELNPHLSVPIVGYVHGDIDVIPARFNVSDLDLNKDNEWLLELKRYKGDPFSLESVSSENYHLDFQIKEIISGESYQVRVRLKQKNYSKHFVHDTILVSTTSKAHPLIEIPFLGVFKNEDE